MTPNNILYTHRSFFCSAIIRKASVCSEWEQIQRPLIGQCAENEHFSPKWGVVFKSLPSEPEGMQDIKEIDSSEDIRTKAHLNSEGLRQHA